MIRFVNIQADGLHYDNYILIENANDLNAYYEFRKQSIYNAFDNLAGRKQTNSYLAAVAESISHTPIQYLANLIGTVYQDQLERIIDGIKLGISALTGGYFPLPSDCVIEDIKVDNVLFKPKEL